MVPSTSAVTSTTASASGAPSPAVVPVQTRRERTRSVTPADHNPVTTRSPEWRYSPVDALGSLLVDKVDGSVPNARVVPSGAVSVVTVPMSDSLVGRVGLPEDAASAAAWNQSRSATVITASAQDVSELWLTREDLGDTPRATHTVIDVAAHAKTVIVVDSRGHGLLNENVEIVLGESAEAVVVSLQRWDESSLHLASHFASLDRGAKLTHAVITFGAGIVRINPQVLLGGDSASASLLGLYTVQKGQHVESQVYVNHDAPNTVSNVLYKGALQGSGARSVWIGDVLIGREATGTDSYEQNRNLILAPGARADSVPNLEIETGDIVGAGHASATGRFDDEQLFYLQSRGVAEHEARRLVVRGFLSEVLSHVHVPHVQAVLGEALDEAFEAMVSS